ncbi:MAG: protein kinase [Cyanobacteria bacterium P01_D01_bin.116]
MLPGNTLRNRYKIVKLLGSGAFGITYLAQDLDLPDHPLCVVKNLKESQNPEELKDFIVFFSKEAKALYRLGNECNQIPRLFAHFEEKGKFYLVQEYIDGHDLSQEIYAGNKLRESEVIQLLKEILEVLTFIHDKNIIHRDIKAQNLMRRNSDGKIIIIDFGTVKEISQIKKNPHELTNASVIVGTSGYMPTEQLNGYPKLSSDIYAVGMLGIYALTGVRPQDLPKDPDTFEAIWQDRVSVSPKFASILDKMVCSNFTDRYQNASEALQALVPPSEPTAKTLRVAPGNLPVSSPQTFPEKKQRFLIIFGGVFSLAFGIGLLLMVFGRKPDPAIVEPAIVEPTIVDAQTCLKKIDSLSITTKAPDYEDKDIKLFKLLGGDIRNGKLNGCGILIKETEINQKTIQKGMFNQNKLNDRGILIYPNGSEYKGKFINNKPNGTGKLTYADKSEYQGTFQNSQPHGRGTFTFNEKDSKEQYVGNFIRGRSHGIGTLTFKNKNYYIRGEFRNNYEDGEGKIFYNNDCIYEGKFKGTEPHGQGTCISQNGSLETGVWNQGKLKGKNQICCNYTN